MFEPKDMSKYEIKKDKGYILYIDILGYKEAILSNDKNTIGELRELLVKMQPPHLPHFNLFKSFDKEKLYINYFSDNVLIFYPSPRQNLHAFLGMCFIATNIQARGICRGFLTRGSLSYGAIEYNQTIVFGKAVIEAYECEKNNLWPSVCLSPKLKSYVESSNITMDDSILSPFGKYHSTDNDGKKICLDGIEKALKRLNHQKIISESILFKYDWLIEEYNRHFEVKPKKKLVRLPSAIYKIEDDNNVGLWG